MVPVEEVNNHQEEGASASVNPCAGFACPFHFYRGQYGRHIAIVMHLGQCCTLLGAVCVTLGYTALKHLPEITAQRVIGLTCLQLGLGCMLGGFATYTRAQYTKVGGVSPLWSKDILIALYTRIGFLQIFFAFGIGMVGFNHDELWALPFKISGPIGFITGIVMLIAPRIYSRTPCYKSDNQRTAGWTGRHCACGQRTSTVSSNIQDNGNRASSIFQQSGVFSSTGSDIHHTFVHRSVVLPPSYESLTPRVDSPPSYVMVNPVSPPPPYDESMGMPKVEDAEVRPRMTEGGYLPSYDAAVANPIPSAYPD